MATILELKQKALEIRRLILECTTAAGSGHPTSSLSATDLLTALFFGGFFQADLNNPKDPTNDRLIFSKGHASPLFYSLYTAKGALSYEKLMTLRQFDSNIEGHPTMRFEYTEVPTGSLGQGLGVGVGMAINSQFEAKKGNRKYNTFVLLGDSEVAEGSIWEAAQLASYHQLDNLVAILDINRLGQRGETMLGWDLQTYKARFEAFGWQTLVVDGQDMEEVVDAFGQIKNSSNNQPKIILAKTKKGAGISFLEDKEGWHGKALSPEELKLALEELNDLSL
jgi:transketolase